MLTPREKSPLPENVPRGGSYAYFLCGLDCLVGLVVKASASRAEGPGFESGWSGDFFGVKSYQ